MEEITIFLRVLPSYGIITIEVILYINTGIHTLFNPLLVDTKKSYTNCALGIVGVLFIIEDFFSYRVYFKLLSNFLIKLAIFFNNSNHYQFIHFIFGVCYLCYYFMFHNVHVSIIIHIAFVPLFQSSKNMEHNMELLKLAILLCFFTFVPLFHILYL